MSIANVQYEKVRLPVFVPRKLQETERENSQAPDCSDTFAILSGSATICDLECPPARYLGISLNCISRLINPSILDERFSVIN